MIEEHKFIDEFVELVKIKYDKDHNENWREDPLNALWGNFYEKIVELCSKSIIKHVSEKEIMEGLVDVALMASILWTRDKENMINRLADQLPEDFLKG